jgi:uncharacterized protein YndB with AHSA1/START domain
VARESYRTSIVVAAESEAVFDYFTVAERMVRWMGDYAVLDARPGGEFTVDINGVPVRGAYLEVERPRRVVVSWGHAGSERLPPGASTVEVRLSEDAGGTRVQVTHSGLPEPEDASFARGWPHFLARLAVAAPGGDPGPDPLARRTR